MNARIKEIESNFTAFQKESYPKEEMLTEIFAFSREMVGITFNATHADASSLRTYDVRNHLEKVNEDCDHVADELFEQFDLQTHKFNDWLRKELSGSKGEYKALKSVETAHRKLRILKNVELEHNGHKAEIDLVVITTNAVFMLEIKNTARCIQINENGNYIRVGFDAQAHTECNIGEKMNERNYLLREVLKNAGYPEFPICSLLVFTNNDAKVTNDYKYITTAYLSQLPHIIDEYNSTYVLSDKGMAKIENAILEAKCDTVYYPEMDMQEYKETFANLLATLENAKNKKAEEEQEILAAKKKYAVSNTILRVLHAATLAIIKIIK